MSRTLISFCLLLLSFSVSAQVIKLSANAKPLNRVLIGMRDAYGLRFSFDDEQLSHFTISVNQQFPSPQKALEYLLRPISYTYMQDEGVFVIYPLPQPKSPPIEVVVPKRDVRLSGTVFDSQTGESLPYSFVQINKTWIGCDEKGCFNYSSKVDTSFHLTLRHLGYYIKDTVVTSGISHKFYLTSSNYAINEVVVSSLLEKSLHQLELPGSIRANNLVARNIPGNEGGSVFSLLRLLPGVYSAGEQSRDLVIWGGYEGQSQVSLDGFTLFGLKNFNDNISVVNPYMVKDVKVFKGGFGARYDDKVGGIVNITGVDGNLRKPELKANISNLTLNTFASTPITKNSSLAVAYRQTFYNLYEEQTMSQLVTSQNLSSLEEYYIKPNYKFFDLNLKFSGKTESGDSYLVSTYGGKDRFNYSVANGSEDSTIRTHSEQLHTQLGASGQYNKQWRNGNRTSALFSYSSLDADNSETSGTNDAQVLNRFVKLDNMIQEYKLSLEHKFTANAIHAPLVGAGYVATVSSFSQLSTTSIRSVLPSTQGPGHNNQFQTGVVTTKQTMGININSQVLDLYAADRISVIPNVTLDPSVRANRLMFNSTWNLQPRMSVEWHPYENLRFAGSLGKYQQYNSKMYYYEQYTARPRNRREPTTEYLPADEFQQVWTVTDGKKIPYITSTHKVLGAYFQNGGFSASTEMFWKNSSGLSRWKRSFVGVNSSPKDSVFLGKSRSYGVDFMLKKQYLSHYAWISYSYGKTEEHFANEDGYQPAPQDQRHEVKGAVLLDFAHFSFSSSYVYGSGYPTYNGLTLLSNNDRKPYKRMDVSISYRFNPRFVKLHTGVTVLNLLNDKNLIFNNLVSNSSNNSSMFAVYSQAIPFTPMLFLEFSF